MKNLSVIGRNTQGVRLIRLNEGDKVTAVAKLAEGEECAPDSADAPEGPEGEVADETGEAKVADEGPEPAAEGGEAEGAEE